VPKSDDRWSFFSRQNICLHIRESVELPDLILARTIRVLILLYDVSNEESINELCKINLLHFKKHSLWSTVVKVIVGTKCDIEDTDTNENLVTEWIEEQTLLDKENFPTASAWIHLRVSAKTGDGFEAARTRIREAIQIALNDF